MCVSPIIVVCPGVVPVMMMRSRIPMPRYTITMKAGDLEVATVGTGKFTSAHETERVLQCRKSPRIVSAIHTIAPGLTDIDRHPNRMETARHASMRTEATAAAETHLGDWIARG
jgi:hypothetical protein